MTSLLVPPESVRGMTCLDRTAFTVTVELPFLKICGTTLSKTIPVLKKYLFKRRNFKSVQRENDETVIYLNPMLIKTFEDFTEKEKKQLLEMYENFGTAKLILKYDNWASYEILRAILPKEIDVPTSYSIIGHILHLNLRDMHLPYKTIIGQVYLDTIPNVRTVLNKINMIDTTFRNFTMEILAGDENTITTVKENGYTYELDFSKVYWNPRLSTEHETVVINFLKIIFKADVLNRRVAKKTGMEHIVMNLPALAIEFLDVFFDSFDENEIKQMCCQPPTIHLYCFVKTNKGEDACKLGQLLIEQKLGCKLSSDSLIELHFVRNVSLNKDMIRVSFLLTENVLKGEEPAMKRLKTENTVDVLLHLKENKTAKGNKDKTLQIDQQLQELQKEVHQSKPKMKVVNTEQEKKKKAQTATLVQTDATTSLVEKMQI
ncbi:tRNA (guanine(37)-N1)-methyltransferase [Melipona quadrifasciata]|uniref:tRNA (Guanine(37)-N1)-methyltransferase n=1 Tax=Melipona quadrifasciata TaxID=166423 RepID=A0A0N1ISZ3_9HYME|nr:tRNA (guanine(37)-N1)-methyltransferase [Melipona quadrifasciata]